METLSPGMMLAALTDAPPNGPLSHASPLGNFLHPTPALLALILCLQIITILGTWIAAKMVVHPDAATFPNALKVWLFSLLVSIGVNVAVVVGLSFIGPSADPMRVALIRWGGVGLLVLVTFLIRMKIYVIGFLRALVIVLLPGVFMVIVIVGFVFTVMKGSTTKEQLAWLQSLSGKTWEHQDPAAKLSDDAAASNEIDQLLNTALHPVGPAPSLPQRESMVQVLQQKLQARRHALPPGNAHESLVYQNQLNRYLYFLNAVVAERRVTPVTPVPFVRAATPTAVSSTH